MLKARVRPILDDAELHITRTAAFDFQDLDNDTNSGESDNLKDNVSDQHRSNLLDTISTSSSFNLGGSFSSGSGARSPSRKASRQYLDTLVKQRKKYVSPRAKRGASLSGAWARAYFGCLLSIIERPQSKSRTIQFLCNFLAPAVTLGVTFFQFNSFNGYYLPIFDVNHLFRIKTSLDMAILFKFPEFQGHLRLLLSGAMIGGIFLFLCFLCLNFKRKGQASFIVNSVAGYVNMVTTIFYM